MSNQPKLLSLNFWTPCTWVHFRREKFVGTKNKHRPFEQVNHEVCTELVKELKEKERVREDGKGGVKEMKEAEEKDEEEVGEDVEHSQRRWVQLKGLFFSEKLKRTEQSG